MLQLCGCHSGNPCPFWIRGWFARIFLLLFFLLSPLRPGHPKLLGPSKRGLVALCASVRTRRVRVPGGNQAQEIFANSVFGRSDWRNWFTISLFCATGLDWFLRSFDFFGFTRLVYFPELSQGVPFASGEACRLDRYSRRSPCLLSMVHGRTHFRSSSEGEERGRREGRAQCVFLGYFIRLLASRKQKAKNLTVKSIIWRGSF